MMSLGDSKSVTLSKFQCLKCFKRLYMLEKWLWELMAFLILAVFSSFIPLTLKVFIFHERDYIRYLGDLRSLILLALEQLFSWGKLVKTRSVRGLHEWAGSLGPVFDSDNFSLCFSGKKIKKYIFYTHVHTHTYVRTHTIWSGKTVVVSFQDSAAQQELW